MMVGQVPKLKLNIAVKIVLSYQRYCDANIKQSLSYCLYAKGIPDFVENCPNGFIKNWLEKSKLAERIPLSHVAMNGYGRFTVQSMARNTLCQDYNVIFGD